MKTKITHYRIQVYWLFNKRISSDDNSKILGHFHCVPQSVRGG
jgi:hypothetical protein